MENLMRSLKYSQILHVYLPICLSGLKLQSEPLLIIQNGPAQFPGRMSYKATKPGLVCLSYLSMLYYCIVVY